MFDIVLSLRMEVRVADGYSYCKIPLFSEIKTEYHKGTYCLFEALLLYLYEMDSCKEHTICSA